MEAYRKWMDSLPLIVRIIFCLPGINGILFGIYRIAKGNLPNVILGIVWIIAGTAVTWILDLIFTLMGKPVFEL